MSEYDRLKEQKDAIMRREREQLEAPLRAQLAAEQLEVELLREEVERLTMRAENAEAAFDQCQENSERLGERRRDAEDALANVREELRVGNQLYAELTDRSFDLHTTIAALEKALAAERTRREAIERFAKELQMAKQAAYEDREEAGASVAVLAQLLEDAPAIHDDSCTYRPGDTVETCRCGVAESRGEIEEALANLPTHAARLRELADTYESCIEMVANVVGTVADTTFTPEQNIVPILTALARLRELAGLADEARDLLSSRQEEYIDGAHSVQWRRRFDTWCNRYQAAKGE